MKCPLYLCAISPHSGKKHETRPVWGLATLLERVNYKFFEVLKKLFFRLFTGGSLCKGWKI